jgi:hypothetical protein
MSAQDAFSLASGADVNLLFFLEDVVIWTVRPEMSFIA